MNKRVKKILALLLGLMLCLTIFAGCGSKDKSSTQDTSDTSKDESSEKDAPSDDGENKSDPLGADFAGYPIELPEEEATLRLWTTGMSYHSDYTSEEESPYHQYLSEFTGVKIIWERPAAGEDSNQAYTLLLASGDLPDIMYFPAGSLNEKVGELLGEGHIIILDDYIETYAPALYSHLTKDSETEKAFKTDDGHFFTFPFMYEDPVWQGSYVGHVVNTECLKEIGRDKPVTLQDWKDTFYDMKDVCDIVFATNNMIRLKVLFANAFGFGTENYYVDNGKVKASFVGDGYYEFLKMAHEFYKDGLIDPDFVTATTSSFSETFVASKVGAATTGTVTFGYVYDQVVERDGDWNYEPVPYPVAKEGDPIIHVQGRTLWNGAGAVITSACENVELACRFLDYGYTEEGVITWNFGKEGESFDFVDGVPTLSPIITEAAEGISEACKRYTCMTTSGPSIMLLDFNKQRNLDFANEVTDVCTANTEEGINYRLPPITATDEEAREVADLQTTIDTHVEEMYIAFITGTQSLDKYDEYIATLEDMGIERLLAIKQEQLDRYNAR